MPPGARSSTKEIESLPLAFPRGGATTARERLRNVYNATLAVVPASPANRKQPNYFCLPTIR